MGSAYFSNMAHPAPESPPSDWTTRQFLAAFDHAEVGLNAKRAELMKSGALNGSRAAFALSDIYLEHANAALAACLEGLANRVQSRGRKWKTGIAAIERALDDHLAKGPSAIANAHGGHYADPSSPVLQNHFQAGANKLQQRLRDFRDGWTAPAGLAWHQRYPGWWAFILLIAGAMLGQLAGEAAHFIWPPPPVQSAEIRRR